MTEHIHVRQGGAEQASPPKDRTRRYVWATYLWAFVFPAIGVYFGILAAWGARNVQSRYHHAARWGLGFALLTTAVSSLVLAYLTRSLA